MDPLPYILVLLVWEGMLQAAKRETQTPDLQLIVCSVYRMCWGNGSTGLVGVAKQCLV